MSWHYQATHRTDHGEDVYEVREIYPDSPWGAEGRPVYTANAVAPYGATKEELLRVLVRMLDDIVRFPVLEVD